MNTMIEIIHNWRSLTTYMVLVTIIYALNNFIEERGSLTNKGSLFPLYE